jgi:hypothetical protein
MMRGIIPYTEKYHSHATSVKAGIRDCANGFIMTNLSFPAFVYETYTANPNDLEEGLFKGKILLQVCGPAVAQS